MHSLLIKKKDMNPFMRPAYLSQTIIPDEVIHFLPELHWINPEMDTICNICQQNNESVALLYPQIHKNQDCGNY